MKIEKFNEFFSTKSDKKISEISKLVEITEMTNKSDLEEISKSDDYQKIINFGKSVIPILLNRNSIWDRALSELTGDGLDPLEYSTSDRKEYWINWRIKNGY